jgi:cytochrome c556
MNLKSMISALAAFFILSLMFGGNVSEAQLATDPTAELNQLDTRTPVPLLPHMALHQKQNMREHLEAVQAIIGALSKKDFKFVEVAASKMGFTPAMGKMCERMGAGAEGFSERAIKFHRSADDIVSFAKKSDQAGVLKSLNSTLTQCTSCHSTYRQQLVDQKTYDAFASKTFSK